MKRIQATTVALYAIACLFIAFGQSLLSPLNAETNEEEAAPPEWKFNGCQTIAALVYHNWPCHPHPAAEPEACKKAKQQQLKEGVCRTGLKRSTDGLKLTGKTHGVYFHKKFSGYKSSGPFVEVLDKQQNLWWVMKFDWDYATKEDQ